MNKEIFILDIFLALGICGCISNDPTTELQRGMDAAVRHDFKEAQLAFTHVISLDPANVKAYDFRGRAYIKLGDYKNAIQDLNKAIEIDPQYGKAYAVRAMAWYYLDEFAKMKADLLKAKELQGSVDVKFENELREGAIVSKIGWIKFLFGPLTTASSGEKIADRQLIILIADDGREYMIEPSLKCNFDVPQTDQGSENALFRAGNDKKYMIEGLASEYKIYSRDGKFIDFSGTKIRATRVKRIK